VVVAVVADDEVLVLEVEAEVREETEVLEPVAEEPVDDVLVEVAVPVPVCAFDTVTEAAKLAACATLKLLPTLIPNATQAKIPCETVLPRNEYSTIGSLVAASAKKILSAALVVRACVLPLYGDTDSTCEMRL